MIKSSPVIEGESLRASVLAVVDGASECAAGVVVCKSTGVRVSSFCGCADVVMLSFGSVCGKIRINNIQKKIEIHCRNAVILTF